jgi:hypothetical protein
MENNFTLTIEFLEKFTSTSTLEENLERNIKNAIAFLKSNGKIMITRILKHLTLKESVVAIPATSFTTNSFFKEGHNGTTKLLLSDDFKNKVLSLASTAINYVGGNVDTLSLTKDMYDSDILLELGNPKTYTVDACLGMLQALISKQPKAEDGTLLTNGYSNIFYVTTGERVLVVDARWHSDNSKWDLSAYELDGFGEWNAGSLVFAPAIV